RRQSHRRHRYTLPHAPERPRPERPELPKLGLGRRPQRIPDGQYWARPGTHGQGLLRRYWPGSRRCGVHHRSPRPALLGEIVHAATPFQSSRRDPHRMATSFPPGHDHWTIAPVGLTARDFGLTPEHTAVGGCRSAMRTKFDDTDL